MTTDPKPPMRQIAELIEGIATARAESAESLLTMCEHQLTLARNDVADRDAQIARVKALLDSAISDCIDRDAEIARLKAALDSESTLRQCREEQLRLLHQDYAGCVRERNEARHAVETWQREYSGALADFEHAQEEIARLKAELAAERDRTTATVTCSRVVPTAAEIRTYMDKLADQPRTGGYVPPAAPPAESHRAWPPAAEIAKWVDDWHAGKIPTPIEPAPPAADPRVDALCRVVWYLGEHQWPYDRRELLVPHLKAALAKIAT